MSEVGEKPVPSQQFLIMTVIQLKKCESQTGMSFVEWLESFEDNDKDLKTDVYNDQTLIKAIQKLNKELYPEEK